jgi:hypothetical protein
VRIQVLLCRVTLERAASSAAAIPRKFQQKGPQLISSSAFIRYALRIPCVLQRTPKSMQGVHRIVQGFLLFCGVPASLKQLVGPQHNRLLCFENAQDRDGLITLENGS